MNETKSLLSLCREYIWWVLVGWDLEGYDYTGNMKRGEIHGKISNILHVETPHQGYLQWALNNLERSANLPNELPSMEDWESISRRCGKQLRVELLRIYGDTNDAKCMECLSRDVGQ